jgi:hypothetical protein
VTATAGQAGSIVRRCRYEPYGKQISPEPGLDTADPNPWRFASDYFAQATGMLKFGRRYYMPDGCSERVTSRPQSTEAAIERRPASGDCGFRPTSLGRVWGARRWKKPRDIERYRETKSLIGTQMAAFSQVTENFPTYLSRR